MSFILLRRNRPDLERPYVSLFGVVGAALTIVIALVTLGLQLSDPVYRQGIAGVAVWFAVPAAYFALYVRYKLILSPEEQFAMERRIR